MRCILRKVTRKSKRKREAVSGSNNFCVSLLPPLGRCHDVFENKEQPDYEKAKAMANAFLKSAARESTGAEFNAADFAPLCERQRKTGGCFQPPVVGM